VEWIILLISCNEALESRWVFYNSFRLQESFSLENLKDCLSTFMLINLWMPKQFALNSKDLNWGEYNAFLIRVLIKVIDDILYLPNFFLFFSTTHFVLYQCKSTYIQQMRFDQENLRFSEKSQGVIDLLRIKCLKLKCMVLNDGRYYELVKANSKHADRMTVVRNTTRCFVSPYYLLQNYNDLVFNWNSFHIVLYIFLVIELLCLWSMYVWLLPETTKITNINWLWINKTIEYWITIYTT
jgi:hypothetical protein